MAEEETIKKIKATYAEIADLTDEEIQVQLEFATILVEQDIEDGNLKERLKDMGLIYLTCHYLYLNYSKGKKDNIEKSTSFEKAVGVLGKGYEASPYGQQYMLISNKKPFDSKEKNNGAVSGVTFL